MADQTQPGLGALTSMQWFDGGNDVDIALHAARADVDVAAVRPVPHFTAAAAG